MNQFDNSSIHIDFRNANDHNVVTYVCHVKSSRSPQSLTKPEDNQINRVKMLHNQSSQT